MKNITVSKTNQHNLWVKSAIFLQLLTALFHSLSLVVDMQANNDQEKLLYDLMINYQFDFGAGFKHSMMDIFTSFSICFNLLLLYSASLHIHLIRSNTSPDVLKGVLLISIITYSLCFLTMMFLTFLPPVICTGLILISLIMAYTTLNREINTRATKHEMTFTSG